MPSKETGKNRFRGWEVNWAVAQGKMRLIHEGEENIRRLPSDEPGRGSIGNVSREFHQQAELIIRNCLCREKRRHNQQKRRGTRA